MDELAFWYQVIVADYALMEECIAVLDTGGFEGEFRGILQRRLSEDRLQATHLKTDLAKHRVELHLTAAAIAGTQYYLIRHLHPVCLLGYLQALESRKLAPITAEAVEREQGPVVGHIVRKYLMHDAGRVRELESVEIPARYRSMVEASKVQTLLFFEQLVPAINPETSPLLH